MIDLVDYQKELEQIEFFIFCPGGRNREFIVWLDNNKKNYQVAFDERAAAFMALGSSKAGVKSAVVTTSGTAVGECLPAIMEAYHSETYLCIISFDRPEHLKKIKTHQTTHQESALSAYIDNLYTHHINISVNYEQRVDSLMPSCSATPLFIFNGDKLKYLSLLEKLRGKNCYIHIEASSCFFKDRGHSNYIWTDERLKSLFLNEEIGTVYSVGDLPETDLWRILERVEFLGKVYVCSDKMTLSSASKIDLEQLNKIASELALNKTLDLSAERDLIGRLINEYPQSDLAAINTIVQSSEDIYIGNSLSIRTLKAVSFSGKVWASRGLNGIDGQIATAAGIARQTKRRLSCIIGDQTFLYDMNMLWMNLPRNLHIYVIDNNGGEIFRKYKMGTKVINAHNKDLTKITHDQLTIIQTNNSQNENIWVKLSEY